MIRLAGVFLLTAAIGLAEDNVPLVPPPNTLEIDSDGTWSSDIYLTDSRLTYRRQIDKAEVEFSSSYTSYDMDYQPFRDFDFFGFDEHLHEDRFGGQLDLRYAVIDPLTFMASGGLYDGYSNYRRVWIANRYRQKYDHPDFPRIPGYEDPDPKGWNAGAGARWEYIPLKGFAEMNFGYAMDQTAPGYEDGQDVAGNYLLLRGRERLHTRTATVSSENVLTSWLRSLNEFFLFDTTARELRFSYKGSVNIAVAPAWVVRAEGGITTEEPRFDAHFFGAVVEWEALRNFFVSVEGRYYEDNGEIEDSLLTSSAAPPLRSWKLGMALRYMWKQSGLKVGISMFDTNYDPIRIGTAEFRYLYADRKWGLAQIAYSWQF